MRERLNHDSPIPLYHQVCRTLEYRIATGDLRPGDELPSLRVAAAAWGINLHTVRRAYVELARSGLVETHPGSRTVVARSAASSARGRVAERDPAGWQRSSRTHGETADEFVTRFVREARDRHDLLPAALARRVAALGGSDTVWVVERSEAQPPT